MNFLSLVSIAGFGIVGIFMRYLIGAAFSRSSTLVGFPYSTLTINLVGSFFMGLVYVLAVEKGLLTLELRLGVMVGLLGGFTTFSAFSLEALMLLEGGKATAALTYLVLSPALGVALAMGGATLARTLLRS